MRLTEIAVWSLGAGVMLAIIFACGQALGLTRLDIPFILGTMFTSDRDRAKLARAHGLNLVAAAAFGPIYVLFFEIHGHGLRCARSGTVPRTRAKASPSQ